MEVALHQLGPDGLAHMPVRGRPWAGSGSEFYGGIGDGNQLLIPFYNGRMASVLALYAVRDPGGPWTEATQRLVDGLAQLAVDDGERAYFWPSMGHGVKAGDRPREIAMPTSWINCEIRTAPLGLVHAYRHTGYEPALPLAGRFNRYLREQFFRPDGTFISSQDEPGGPIHFHAHTASLLAMVEYAREAADDDMLAFAVRGYEYARRQGEVLSGYFPEFISPQAYHTSELCEVADMIALAIKLSQAGAGDYWDDADRWTRNMFAEGQLIHTDWIARMPTAGLVPPSSVPPSQVDPRSQTTELVAERNVGAFAGWPAMNDWYVGHGVGIMHCCTGNATRTLYQVWEAILHHADGALRVNLLLNRASRWADVDSYIPYEGRVDVRVKQPLALAVRVPEWALLSDVRCRVNGTEREVGWDGRYAQVGQVGSGDVVAVTFPLVERIDQVDVQKARYTLVRRGNEIVAIDPPGRYAPLYQRQHYRAGRVRWREIEHFVSDETIEW
jgi:hypothetical protein